MTQFENISCPVCASSDYALIQRTKDFRLKISDTVFSIVRCNKCEFVFLNPRPSKAESMNFYSSDFHKQDNTLFYKIIEPFFRLSQESIGKTFKKYKKSGSLLDIGCGNGSFIMFMQKFGYDVRGVELNPEAEKFASNLLKDRIFYKELKDCDFPEKTFDIITMMQSLEHVYDLNEILSEIRRVLKDDGILFISVPNAAFFESRLFGPYYYNLEAPRHLYFFTKESIKSLMLKNDFLVDKFFRNSLLESVSTPASLYHSLWSFLNDRKLLTNDILKGLTFFPLVIVRFFLRLFFIFDDQNLKVLCSKV